MKINYNFFSFGEDNEGNFLTILNSNANHSTSSLVYNGNKYNRYKIEDVENDASIALYCNKKTEEHVAVLFWK
jgi:hypothetical protein